MQYSCLDQNKESVQFNSPGEEECKWSRYADTTDMCENDQKQELLFLISDTLPHSKKDWIDSQ